MILGSRLLGLRRNSPLLRLSMEWQSLLGTFHLYLLNAFIAGVLDIKLLLSGTSTSSDSVCSAMITPNSSTLLQLIRTNNRGSVCNLWEAPQPPSGKRILHSQSSILTRNISCQPISKHISSTLQRLLSIPKMSAGNFCTTTKRTSTY
jgi:hypothetical protein